MKISKELKIGVVAIISIIAFYWLFKFLQGENLFTRGKIVYAKYSDVDGLLPTKPVNVNGMKVGRVEDIIIKEAEDSIYFVVQMVIERDLDFTTNTVAEIYEPGLMAGKMVKLTLSYEGKLAKDGDTLISANKPSLMSMLSNKLAPTQNRIDSVLITLNSALGRFSSIADEETNQSLKSVLKQLDATIYALGQTANSVTRTSDEANKILSNSGRGIDALTKNANVLVNTTNTTMQKYGNVADKINNVKLEESFADIADATVALKSTLERIENSDGTLNKIINDPGLYNNLSETTENLNKLMVDLQERPDRYVQFSVFGKKYKEKPKEVEIENIEEVNIKQ